MGRLGNKPESIEKNFFEKVDKNGPMHPYNESLGNCWIWKAFSDGRYGRFRHSSINASTAHRVSWTMKNGPIPNGFFVCHSCDVTLCVNPVHLFIGTPKQNSQDMVKKERHIKGEEQHLSVFNVADVIIIREMVSAKIKKQAEIARIYGVNKTSISCLVKKKTWKHV